MNFKKYAVMDEVVNPALIRRCKYSTLRRNDPGKTRKKQDRLLLKID
jgi:hypothetical protein